MADLSTASAFATNLQVGPAYVTSVTASQTGEIGSGKTIQFTVTLSDAVTLDSAGGMPTLLLNNGAIATYNFGRLESDWAGTLIFDYAVGPGDYTTDLKVSGLDLNGAVVRDRNGVEADLSGAAGSDLFVGVNAVTVTGLTALPQAAEASAGQIVTLTLSLSAGVTVSTAGGSPVLVLDDGVGATYDAQASNPSAGILVFDYAVGTTDETPDLTASRVDLAGATISDATENQPDFSGVSNFATGLQVGPAFITSVAAAQSGEVHSGDTVQLTVGTSGPVTTDTTSGSPTLSLSDGAIATYDAAASSSVDGRPGVRVRGRSGRLCDRSFGLRIEPERGDRQGRPRHRARWRGSNRRRFRTPRQRADRDRSDEFAAERGGQCRPKGRVDPQLERKGHRQLCRPVADLEPE